MRAPRSCRRSAASRVCPIELRVVAALARAIGTGIELLAVAGIADAMSFEERAAAVGKGDCTVLVIHRNALDEPLPFEVAEVAIADVKRCISRVVQIALGDYAKCADGRQRARVGATQAVVAIAVADQLALGSARQIEVT